LIRLYAMTLSTAHSLPPLARWLGYAGLIPFVAAAALVWFLPATDRATPAFALTAYGATIASFLGAVHWGLAMRDPNHQPTLHHIWAVIPSLLAWLAMLLAPRAGLVLLAVLLGLCYAIDHRTYADFRVQHWLHLRLQLTAVAAASCLVAAAGLAT
jgi:predicted membrane-bound spermidine synthase